MEKLFIDAKSNLNIQKVLKKIKERGKAGLVTTIQHLHLMKKAQKIIPGSIIGGQVLGCDVSAAKRIKDQIDFFIYIGTGEFHPLGIALKTKKKVIVANPLTEEVSEVSQKDIQTYQKRIKGKYLKFLSAEKIGILVSTKPGQNHFQEALEFKKKINKPSYIFIADTLSENELENYKDIDIFINTACPRIEFKNVISLEEIQNFKRLIK